MSQDSEYWKFAESEDHFNDIQSGIRNLASGWMLAAFGAIAILLRSDANVTWLVSPVVLVGVVSFMATLGLLVLWINDQFVYQRLLDCGFIIALNMEYHDNQLPPIRSMMAHSPKGTGMSRWMTLFYTIPMWSFLAVTVAAMLLRESVGTTSRGLGNKQSLIVLTVLGLAQLFATIWVQLKESEVGAKTRAPLFGDKDFAAMFDDAPGEHVRLTNVIGRYRPVSSTGAKDPKGPLK